MLKKLLILVIALSLLGFVSIIVYRFVFLNFSRVPTGAMANTIIPGDHLVVKKRWFGEIERGDIIIFSYPGESSYRYVSRVVGRPGESIEVRKRAVYINGRELPESRVTVVSSHSSSGSLEELEGNRRLQGFLRSS
jgi:signal peptidase I